MPGDGALEFRLVPGRQNGEVTHHPGAFSRTDRLHQNPRTLFHERFPSRIESFSHADGGLLQRDTRAAEHLLEWLANHRDLLLGEIGLLESRENFRLADLAVSRGPLVGKLANQAHRRGGLDAGQCPRGFERRHILAGIEGDGVFGGCQHFPVESFHAKLHLVGWAVVFIKQTARARDRFTRKPSALLGIIRKAHALQELIEAIQARVWLALGQRGIPHIDGRGAGLDEGGLDAELAGGVAMVELEPLHIVERLVAEKDIAEFPRRVEVHPVELPIHFLAIREKEDVVAELLPAIAPDAGGHILRGDFIAGRTSFQRAVLLPDIADFVPDHRLVGAVFLPVRPHGRGVVVLGQDIPVATPFAEVAVEGRARRIEPVTELDQENRLGKIAPVKLVRDRPHHHRRMVAQPLHQVLHVGLGKIFRRQAEMVAGLGDQEKSHLVRRIVDFLVAGQVVQAHEFHTLALELANPGLAVFLAALQVALRMIAVSAQENLVSIQVEMRSLPSDLTKAKSLAMPVKNLAVGSHDFGFQKIQKRVVNRPQVRVAPSLGGGQGFLRAGSNRQLLRGGPRFHNLAVLFHHAEPQADRLLFRTIIAHRGIAGDLAALHRSFHKEIGSDTHLGDELQKHIPIDATATLVVVLEKPAIFGIGHMDAQFILAWLHRIGDVEFKRHIGIPPIANLLAVHRDFPDMADTADMNQDAAVAEVFGHFDRSHIGRWAFSPVVGVVPDIPVLFSPELVLPRKRTRHAHLHRFFDSFQFEVPGSIQANFIAQGWLSGIGGQATLKSKSGQHEECEDESHIFMHEREIPMKRFVQIARPDGSQRTGCD